MYSAEEDAKREISGSVRTAYSGNPQSGTAPFLLVFPSDVCLLCSLSWLGPQDALYTARKFGALDRRSISFCCSSSFPRLIRLRIVWSVIFSELFFRVAISSIRRNLSSAPQIFNPGQICLPGEKNSFATIDSPGQFLHEQKIFNQ